MVTDQTRSPAAFLSSALCSVAPRTGVNENVPPAGDSEAGGGSQLETATVAAAFTPRSHDRVAGSAWPFALWAWARRSTVAPASAPVGFGIRDVVWVWSRTGKMIGMRPDAPSSIIG